MVAYSFKQRFVEPILTGTKQQTIRAPRRRHARVGETTQLYTGMRTKSCRLIATAPCVSVWPISIGFAAREIIYGGRVLVMQQDLDAFARMDGFDDWWQMREFWLANHGADLPDPWQGVLIGWGGLES